MNREAVRVATHYCTRPNREAEAVSVATHYCTRPNREAEAVSVATHYCSRALVNVNHRKRMLYRYCQIPSQSPTRLKNP